jgi:alpha-beta hydrolase superfamily lysophospholipase
VTRLTLAFALAATLLTALSAAAAGLVEEPVAVMTHDDLVLEGRLIRPGTGPAAAGVVLLHGSGATDMDETVPPNLTATGRQERPFRELAHRLARAGFAVLRYNKRGVDTDARLNDPHVLETAGLADLVADAAAAVALLRSTGAVATDRIILVGHSEGSVIGSLLAERDRGIAGLACLAPMAHGLKEILHYQLVDRVIAWAFSQVDGDSDGRLTASELARQPRYRIPLAKLDVDGDGAVDRRELARGLEADWDRFITTSPSASPWLADHLALEPNLSRLARLAIPVQLFHGEEDAQTPISESRALVHALARRACGPATLDTFPGLGHGFAPPLAPDRPTVGPFSNAALDTIAGRLARVYLGSAQNVSETPPPKWPALD